MSIPPTKPHKLLVNSTLLYQHWTTIVILLSMNSNFSVILYTVISS